jgi:hypothetical protein
LLLHQQQQPPVLLLKADQPPRNAQPLRLQLVALRLQPQQLALPLLAQQDASLWVQMLLLALVPQLPVLHAPGLQLHLQQSLLLEQQQ